MPSPKRKPISLLVSVKTSQPRVADYWLTVPAAVLTIDDLKRHLMSTLAIDGHNEVDLWLDNGLLRDGRTPVGHILMNRDHLEVRPANADHYPVIPAIVSADEVDRSDAESTDSRTTYTVTSRQIEEQMNSSGERFPILNDLDALANSTYTSCANNCSPQSVASELSNRSRRKAIKSADSLLDCESSESHYMTVADNETWTRHLVDSSDNDYYSTLNISSKKRSKRRSKSSRSTNTSPIVSGHSLDTLLGQTETLAAEDMTGDEDRLEGLEPLSTSTPKASPTVVNEEKLKISPNDSTFMLTQPQPESSVKDLNGNSTTDLVIICSDMNEETVDVIDAKSDAIADVSANSEPLYYFGFGNIHEWYKEYIKSIRSVTSAAPSSADRSRRTSNVTNTSSDIENTSSLVINELKDKFKDLDINYDSNNSSLDVSLGVDSVSQIADKVKREVFNEDVDATGAAPEPIPALIQTMAVLMATERKTNGGFTFNVIMSLPIGTADDCPLVDNYTLQMDTLANRIDSTNRRLEALRKDMARAGLTPLAASDSRDALSVSEMSTFIMHLFPFPHITAGPRDLVDERNARLLEYLVLKQELAVNKEALIHHMNSFN
ncbi:unnamed protein product [Medioppia subpectinata]|uniref:Uncharacterized protein n=1 Tax=Medioppia subpectinata TaxID=1979941 RepID=A0A7R9KI65_9ACAR|nr:unnamed protein product [Medioppia subpectinata]CAG2103689.1 unnamed protein product [Medioppia subpectinata]